jgi:competence protein ComEA
MRSRRSVQADVAEVARRRLELLSAELAEIRPDPVDPPSPGARDGSGELSESRDHDRDPTHRQGPGTDPAAGGASPLPGPGRHAHRGVGLRAAVAGWAGDRLPPVVQRASLRGPHLVVVLLAVLAAGALTWWWVGRGSDETVTTPTVDSVAPLVTPEGSPSTPSRSGSGVVPPTATGSASPVANAGGGSGAGSIVVDVVGKVRRPGIATLPGGSRVVDALKAAGGARHGTSLASLNLARPLVDGEQIVVGVRAPLGVAPSAAAGPGGAAAPTGASSAVPMVNINTADQAMLEQLPGVGPVTARSILDYRAEKGSFSAVDELLEVSGIGDKTLADIAPYCTI